MESLLCLSQIPHNLTLFYPQNITMSFVSSPALLLIWKIEHIFFYTSSTSFRVVLLNATYECSLSDVTEYI